MIDLVQTTLDTALNGSVKVYWQRKSGKDADEYIVFTKGGDANQDFADDVALTKSTSVTVRYYYRAEKIDNHSGRQSVKNRVKEIETALLAAGFSIPEGSYDAGDVDDIGYLVTVFECEYWRVV